MDKKISLTVNGTELRFTITPETYKRYVNELTPANKIAPAKNFLVRSIDADCKDALKQFLEIPSFEMHCVGQLMDEYLPDLEFELGK